MPETLTIMFADLDNQTQREALKFYAYPSAEEGNFDMVPLFVLEKEEPRQE